MNNMFNNQVPIVRGSDERLNVFGDLSFVSVHHYGSAGTMQQQMAMQQQQQMMLGMMQIQNQQLQNQRMQLALEAKKVEMAAKMIGNNNPNQNDGLFINDQTENKTLKLASNNINFKEEIIEDNVEDVEYVVKDAIGSEEIDNHEVKEQGVYNIPSKLTNIYKNGELLEGITYEKLYKCDDGIVYIPVNFSNWRNSARNAISKYNNTKVKINLDLDNCNDYILGCHINTNSVVQHLPSAIILVKRVSVERFYEIKDDVYINELYQKFTNYVDGISFKFKYIGVLIEPYLTKDISFENKFIDPKYFTENNIFSDYSYIISNLETRYNHFKIEEIS